MTTTASLFTWDDLASWRWGDAVGDPTPGIIVQPECKPVGDLRGLHLGRAIQHVAGFLMWGPKPRRDVETMAASEGIPMEDAERAAETLEIIRENTDGCETWRLAPFQPLDPIPTVR
jgi:hypothetical protein